MDGITLGNYFPLLIKLIKSYIEEYLFPFYFIAPPPFKLKRSPKRSIVSKSPFSTDRVYDLPKGKAFEVKKSDKEPTKFKEFRNVDASWKVTFNVEF